MDQIGDNRRVYATYIYIYIYGYQHDHFTLLACARDNYPKNKAIRGMEGLLY